jgi:hypothetical protein
MVNQNGSRQTVPSLSRQKTTLALDGEKLMGNGLRQNR